MSTIKGQNLRVMVASKCVAMATSCTVHVSSQVEDSSTKDSTGDWAENEVTGLSWDVQTDSLVCLSDTGETSVELLQLIINKTEVTLTFDQTQPNTSQNRQPVSPTSAIKCHGKAYLTDFSLSAPNRQNSTLSCQFTGNGALSLG